MMADVAINIADLAGSTQQQHGLFPQHSLRIAYVTTVGKQCVPQSSVLYCIYRDKWHSYAAILRIMCYHLPYQAGDIRTRNFHLTIPNV